MAERKNRTIVEKARNMMKEKELLAEYWEEVVATISDLINRCPKKLVHDNIPLMVWSKNRWIIEHLRVFECVTYANEPKEKRQKLDEKCVKCIFAGYNSIPKAYRYMIQLIRSF